MKTKSIIIATLCCIAGVLFFLINRKWLIIQLGFYPSAQQYTTSVTNSDIAAKKISLYFYKQEAWQKREVSFLWQTDNQEHNLTQLIKSWLSLLQDEHILPSNITLESVALSSSGNEAYVSFDRSIFLAEWPIIKKWFVLEGLFRTMYHAEMVVQTITLLVNQKPMYDEHIDFSQPLPVQERLQS